MTTKKCPFCAEEVLSDAKLCKHCGKKLGGTPISESHKRWIHINHIGGSVIGCAIVFAVVGVLIAEYTGIAGGLAAIARPWSESRNEMADIYGTGGFFIGLALIGPLVGRSSARNEIARREGQNEQ